MDEYGFTNYPDSILFVFKLVDGKVNPIILRNLLLNKPKVANTKLYNFDKPLPLTLNHSKYGVLLQAIFSRENVISHFIKPNYLGEEIVFTDFGDKYLYQVKTLGLKPVDILQFKSNGLYYLKDNILVYIVKEGNKSTKYLLDKSGILIKTIIDISTDNINFTRKIGNVSIVVLDNKVTDYSIKVKLNPIEYKIKKVLDISNPMFGTIDLETYPSEQGYNKVYAAGLYTKDDKSLFYIDDNLNSEKVIIDLIESMLVSKYNNYTFYAHNFSGYDGPFIFDGPFILKTILDYNAAQGSQIYNMDTIFRDNRIISMTISKKVFTNNGKRSSVNKFVILDSLLMLNSKLKDLGESYEVDVVKGLFPHSFASFQLVYFFV